LFLPGGKRRAGRAAGLVVVVGDEAAEEGDLGAADVGPAVDVVRMDRGAVGGV